MLKISGFSTARSYLLAWVLRTLRILACPFERVHGPGFSTQYRQSEPPWGQRTEPLFGCNSQVWRAGRLGTTARPARFASASKPAPTTDQIHVDLPQGPP